MKKEIIDRLYYLSEAIVGYKSELNYLKSLKRLQPDEKPVKNVQLFIHNNLSEKLSRGNGFVYHLPNKIIEKVLDIAIEDFENKIEIYEDSINKLRSELC